jgi:hypothetical protein
MPEKFKNSSPEDIARAYVNAESQLGKMGNELGEVKGERDRYAVDYDATHMYDPDDPSGKSIISKLEFEHRQSQAPQAKQGEMSRAELAEKLEIMRDEDPIAHDQMLMQGAAQLAVRQLNERDAVYATPTAQEVLTENPNIRARVDQIAMERNLSLQDAFTFAAGESRLAGPGGGNAPAITPQINLTALTAPSHTFMGPQGTIPDTKPKSNLDPDQIAFGKEMGVTVEMMEPYAIPKENK